MIDNIYEATVTAENIDKRQYVGSTATTFKKGHSNHKSDFKISSRRKATKLSGYIWELNPNQSGGGQLWPPLPYVRIFRQSFLYRHFPGF